MHFASAYSHRNIQLAWPLLPAPLLNSAAFALRPALTLADRHRYLEMATRLERRSTHLMTTRAEQVIRADLIEDKMRGGVIGITRISRFGHEYSVQIHILTMHDSDLTRAAVANMLATHLPGSRCLDIKTQPREKGDGLPAAVACWRSRLLSDLAVPSTYAEDHQLAWIEEPSRLHYAGRDYVGRTLWLQHGAMQAWSKMHRAASDAGIGLVAVSGFRSIGYQASLLRRKLERGMDIAEVLAINTAPGYSEHHSGRAIDIGTAGCPPAEEVFETTPAFAWLRQHAAQYGFRMSYPRGNAHGVIYEPWHWYWHL